MIPLTDVGWHEQSWQWHLSNAVTDINELVRYLELEGRHENLSDFPVLVPRPFLDRIEKSNPRDPLLLQVLPRAEESFAVDGYLPDPLMEGRQTPRRGMIYKYKGRVLVIVSGACGINCRYCFRRHFPYQGFQPDSAAWERLFEYIGNQPDITEVILSGGDPLVLSDRRLARIADRIAGIPHVHTLRIHTRLPVVIPQRVCNELIEWIGRSRLDIVFVIHANHPAELDDAVSDAMAALAGAGIHLLNQSVLLREVNDDPGVLARLSRRLFRIGVMPYYLHLPDKVRGTSHFDVSEDRARRLFADLAAELPGYLVPRLAREVPGEASKVILGFPAV